MLRPMVKSGGPIEKRKAAKAAEEQPRSRRARAVSDMLPDVGRAAFRRFGSFAAAGAIFFLGSPDLTINSSMA